jgi:hypothetical protein
MSRPVPFSWIAVAIVSMFVLIGAASMSAGQTSAAPSVPTNPAAAATTAEVAAAPATGRTLTKDDWIAHIPLWLGMIVLVIVVDSLFVGKILYNRSRQRAAIPVVSGMPPR